MPRTRSGAPAGAKREPWWHAEAPRKAIHLSFILLPVVYLHGWLPWPHTRGQWRVLLVSMVVVAMAVDLMRLHDRRVRRFFGRFLGGMIRPHERFNLLGSTYLLLASLLAIELFSPAVAAAAIGYTVLGDGLAALGGKAFGRTRFFSKTLEGAAVGLAGCLAWGAYLGATGRLDWEVVLAGALVASLVEILPIPLDDNLGMTLFAGYTMKLLGG